MEVKNTKLLFLYRTFLFRFVKFTTKNKELKEVVHALNIKKRRERITYVFDEAIRVLNKYYDKDLCQFIDGKCIAQRMNNSPYVNGCCKRCPLVTDRGCPSVNITCKLIYCKTAAKNIKLLKLGDIKILKCLSVKQRIIILASSLMTREEVIKNINYGIIYTVARGLASEIKNGFYFKKYQ